MKNIFLVLAILLIFTSNVYAESFTGKCICVLSGDTIVVINKNKLAVVRLEGIDCPEEGQQCYYAAKQFTTNLIRGKDVWVDVRRLDHDKRLMSRVKVDNLDVSSELVRTGLAWYCDKYSENDDLRKIAETTQKKKLGLWAQQAPTAPWDYRRTSSGIKPIGLSEKEIKQISRSSSRRKSPDYGFVPASNRTVKSSFGIHVPSVATHIHSLSSRGIRSVNPNSTQKFSYISGYGNKGSMSSTSSSSRTNKKSRSSSRRDYDEVVVRNQSGSGTNMCYVCIQQCPLDKLIWFDMINIHVCDKCVTKGIDNSAFVQTLYKKVRETIETNWGMWGAGVPNLDHSYLEKNILGLYNNRWNEIKIGRHHTIVMTMAIIAHEFAHAWQHSNYPEMKNPLYKEGFATWIQYHFIKSMGYESVARQSVGITPELYQNGFNFFANAEDRYGFDSVLGNFLKLIEEAENPDKVEGFK